jgi:protein SCO1/2
MRALAAMPAAVALVAAIFVVPAQAGLTKAQLDGVFVKLPADATLPLALGFRDENGRATTLRAAMAGKPAVVIFSDYTCSNICGPVLAFAAGGLAKSALTPGRDFRLISIGLDPKDSLADARAMKRTRIGSDGALAAATAMLSGGEDAIDAATRAAGYHYSYDKAAGQFAHPAVALVVTAQGRIARVLSGLGLDGQDLRLALVEAGQGRVGTVADRIRVLCYAYDPATGVYSAAIGRVMTAMAIATLAALGAFIVLLSLRGRRRAKA